MSTPVLDQSGAVAKPSRALNRSRIRAKRQFPVLGRLSTQVSEWNVFSD